MLPIVTKIGDYTPSSLDWTIAVNAVSGPVTIQLPLATITGQTYNIKSASNATGPITVAPTGGQTIDGEASQILGAYENLLVQSDGTNWLIL